MNRTLLLLRIPAHTPEHGNNKNRITQSGLSPFFRTVLLILTNSTDETATYLISRLPKIIKRVRVDSDTIPQRSRIEFRGDFPRLTYRRATFAPIDIKAVWFRRPKPISINLSRDPAENAHISTEFGAALESFLAHIPIERWINHPIYNVQASHKIEQLTRARSYGLQTPETLVTQSKDALIQFYKRFSGKIIVKPLAAGYLERTDPKNDSQIYTNVVTREHLLNAASVRKCPTLFQEQIDKKIDARICVVDDQCVCVGMKAGESGQQRVDIRRDNMRGVEHFPITLPRPIKRRLMALIKSYRLRFAAVDMALTKSDEWVFFEINPNGQWAWLDLCGAADIASTLISSFQQ